MRAQVSINFRLRYADHNEEFASLLSRDGTITRVLRSSDGREWVLFHINEKMSYRQEEFEYLLLGSRSGGKIDDFYPTPVFIYVVDDPSKLSDGFHPDRACHVAWGELLRW